MQLLQDWVAGAGLDQARVLEVGCGPGLLTVELQWLGNSVCAADKSCAMVEAARALAQQRGLTIGLFRTDMVTDCPFAADSFDRVLAAPVINVVQDKRAFVRALCAVTKPGGQISLLVPTPEFSAQRAAAYAQRRGFGSMAHAVLLTWSRLSKNWARTSCARCSRDPVVLATVCAPGASPPVVSPRVVRLGHGGF
jgi:2-polyprenyl-3-methyl-5-hydroxy-6-metoxy-1,4-benzoquinol methylase